jgi:hypothetical protein
VNERPDADETMSSSSSLWHVWYREYETRWDAKVQAILDRFPDRADVIREHLKPTLVPLPQRWSGLRSRRKPTYNG